MNSSFSTSIPSNYLMPSLKSLPRSCVASGVIGIVIGTISGTSEVACAKIAVINTLAHQIIFLSLSQLTHFSSNQDLNNDNTRYWMFILSSFLSSARTISALKSTELIQPKITYALYIIATTLLMHRSAEACK